MYIAIGNAFAALNLSKGKYNRAGGWPLAGQPSPYCSAFISMWVVKGQFKGVICQLFSSASLNAQIKIF